MVKVNHKTPSLYLYAFVYMSSCQYVVIRGGKQQGIFAKTIKSVNFWRIFRHGFLIGYCIFTAACQSYPQQGSL